MAHEYSNPCCFGCATGHRCEKANSLYAPNLDTPNLNGGGEYVGLGRHFDVVGPQPHQGLFQAVDEPEAVTDTLSDEDMLPELRKGLGLTPASPQMVLSADSMERKATPIFSGVLRYFPRALAIIAQLSLAANEKHNGVGAPLHWAEGKSNDHLDALTRHLIDSGAVDPEFGFLHDVGLAWRALANLETILKQLEQERS